MVNIGIIGLGSMGLYHALNITKCNGASIIAVSDVNKTGYRTLLDKGLKNIRFIEDPFKLIESSFVDAILIASPDNTHYDLLKHCLINKKQVFCEKPIACDSDSALDIINREVKLNKKFIALGFNRRFDNNFVRLKKVIESSEIGESLLYKGIHRNEKSFYKSDSAFILNNSAGHDVDIASFLLNSRAKEVGVVGIKSNSLLDDDSADLLLMTIIFENNKMANIEVFVNAHYGYEVEAEVVCSKGVINYLNSNNITLKTNNNKFNKLTSDYRNYFEQSYLDEMYNWISFLNSRSKLKMATAYDGYAALKTTETATKSLLSHSYQRCELLTTPTLYK